MRNSISTLCRTTDFLGCRAVLCPIWSSLGCACPFPPFDKSSWLPCLWLCLILLSWLGAFLGYSWVAQSVGLNTSWFFLWLARWSVQLYFINITFSVCLIEFMFPIPRGMANCWWHSLGCCFGSPVFLALRPRWIWLALLVPCHAAHITVATCWHNRPFKLIFILVLPSLINTLVYFSYGLNYW